MRPKPFCPFSYAKNYPTVHLHAKLRRSKHKWLIETNLPRLVTGAPHDSSLRMKISYWTKGFVRAWWEAACHWCSRCYWTRINPSFEVQIANGRTQEILWIFHEGWIIEIGNDPEDFKALQAASRSQVTASRSLTHNLVPARPAGGRHQW